jgi:Single-strand binding protein family
MPRQTADTAVATAEEAPARSRPFGIAHFQIFGRLAAHAEPRFGGNGNPVARVPLAVNDRAGQVHYLDVVLFGKGAKVLSQYAVKGRGLVVTGRIRPARGRPRTARDASPWTSSPTTATSRVAHWRRPRSRRRPGWRCKRRSGLGPHGSIALRVMTPGIVPQR